MSDTPMTDVCEHGGLRRHCDICRLEKQLAEAVELRLKQAEEFDVIVAGHEERIKELEGALDTIKAWAWDNATIEIELIKLYAAGVREGEKMSECSCSECRAGVKEVQDLHKYLYATPIEEMGKIMEIVEECGKLKGQMEEKNTRIINLEHDLAEVRATRYGEDMAELYISLRKQLAEAQAELAKWRATPFITTTGGIHEMDHAE